MFHPHTVAVKAKRAGSIKQRTDSPAACHGSNCGFITDRADQYGTLDSTQRRMIWSLSYRNFFYRGGLDTSIRVWGWRDLALSHIRGERKRERARGRKPHPFFAVFLLLMTLPCLCSPRHTYMHKCRNTHTHSHTHCVAAVSSILMWPWCSWRELAMNWRGGERSARH